MTEPKLAGFSVIAGAFSNLQQANVRIILAVGVIALKLHGSLFSTLKKKTGTSRTRRVDS